MPPVTIASLYRHGVRQLLVYYNGKREGDWPCRHQAALPIERFSSDECLREIEQRCRCTACGWRRADLRPDYSRQQAIWRRVDNAAVTFFDVHLRQNLGASRR